METRDIKKLGFTGLSPLPEDKRDFSLGALFKQIDIKSVPLIDFVIAEPIKIKDQGNTDYCSAYTVTEVSEDQEGEELLPEFQFFKTKQLMGDDAWGADLRTAFKVPTVFGSLPVKGNENFQGISRETILNPATWPIELTPMALKHKKETYFKVTGRYDTFDNIRTVLWQFKDERRSIGVGAMWRSSWTDAVDGVIDEKETAGEFGHAFKIYGQKIINGEPYLVAQLSNGTDIGDGGRYYFPRSVVNRDFTPFGQFMFKDIPREIVENYKQMGIRFDDNNFNNIWAQIWKFVINIFNK